MDFLKLLKTERVIVWDGGFGTTIASLCHCEPLPRRMAGQGRSNPVNTPDRHAPKGARDDIQLRCNEELNLIAPDIVQAVHEDFIRAGSQVIETNTFGANRIALAEHGLEDKVREINLAAVRIAKEAINAVIASEAKQSPAHTGLLRRCTPRNDTCCAQFISASIGPTSKLPTLGHVSFNEMVDVYREQALALIEGGVDILQIETCQDILQAKAAVVGCKMALSLRGVPTHVGTPKQSRVNNCVHGIASPLDKLGARNDTLIPIIVTITLERSGTTLLGTEVGAALAALAPLGISAFGLNCGTGPAEMEEAVAFLSKNSPLPIIVQPNAGLPEIKDGIAHYNLAPAEFAEWMGYFVKKFGVRLIGGCCGTTAGHIRAVVIARSPKGVTKQSRERNCINGIASPLARLGARNDMLSSLYSAIQIDQSPPPLIVGERMNINGSKEFREHILADNFDAAAGMAKRQAERGAHILDLSVAYAGRDEVKDMHEMASRLATASPLPIMIDSTNPEAIKAALSHLGGRSIINSINLEDGGKKAEKVIEMARQHGAALVALTIDEKGMAMTAAKKVAIAKRLIKLCKGLTVFVDLLTFTLADPKAAEFGSGRETLKAIKSLKHRTLLGVSNISYGFKPEARKVLNSIFLYEAVKAGLDAAIVHAGQILPLHKIEKQAAKLAFDLIHCKRADALRRFTQYFESGTCNLKPETKSSRIMDLEPRKILQLKIIDGNKEGLEGTIREVLKKVRAEEIINKVLLPAMQVVGERFGNNELPLPFVLQSAEVMRAAVDILKPYLKAGEASSRGTIVLATVRGDVHDIGKNLVDIIFSNNGYKVINLGVKQPAHEVIEAALKYKADAIGLSGLIVQSCMVMKDDLAEMARREMKIPVICGGAALTKKFVENDLQKVYGGTVHYARDAFEGLKILGTFLPRTRG